METPRFMLLLLPRACVNVSSHFGAARIRLGIGGGCAMMPPRYGKQ